MDISAPDIVGAVLLLDASWVDAAPEDFKPAVSENGAVAVQWILSWECVAR